MAKRRVWGIRAAVVENPNSPVETLVHRANDEDTLVRWYVARNLNTPPESLAELAGNNFG